MVSIRLELGRDIVVTDGIAEGQYLITIDKKVFLNFEITRFLIGVVL